MQSRDFDLFVIGGGPAGYHSAAKAALAGLSCGLAEKDSIGGVCLNAGCIPSKTFLKSSSLFHSAKTSKPFGVTPSDVTFDMTSLQVRKNNVVGTMQKGIMGTLKKAGAEVYNTRAEILSKDKEGFTISLGEKVVTSTNVLIATGSSPIKPKIPGIDKDIVVYNKEFLALDNLPSSTVIVGGGVIGLEMAQFLVELDCKVTVVEMLPSIGGNIDSDIAKILLQSLKKAGVNFQLESKVIGINDSSVSVQTPKGNIDIDADTVLISVGRVPNILELGLEKLFVNVENGAIVTDGICRTNVSGLYAAGDVNGKFMLAHTAYREGEVVVNTILGKSDKVNYNAIPSVIFTHPEVASVGLTEDIAMEMGFDFSVRKLMMNSNGRFFAENDKARGFCKVLISEDDKVLGVHSVGNLSSEIISAASVIIGTECNIYDIERIVFPHPTVSEIIKETILS